MELQWNEDYDHSVQPVVINSGFGDYVVQSEMPPGLYTISVKAKGYYSQSWTTYVDNDKSLVFKLMSKKKGFLSHLETQGSE